MKCEIKYFFLKSVLIINESSSSLATDEFLSLFAVDKIVIYLLMSEFLLIISNICVISFFHLMLLLGMLATC